MKYKTVKKLTDKGFPTSSSRYEESHRKANEAEKKKYGKEAFEETVKLERKINQHELLGKNTKSGKIEIEKKVPKKMRDEIAYHEEMENKNLRKK